MVYLYIGIIIFTILIIIYWSRENFTLIHRKRRVPKYPKYKGIFDHYEYTYCGHPYSNPKFCKVPNCGTVAESVSKYYGYNKCKNTNKK